jgi:Putative adhesin
MIPVLSCRRVSLVTASLAVALFALTLPAAAQGPEGAFERTLTVTGAVDLDVQSGSGAIRVEPGASGTVRVAARLKAGNAWLAGSDVEKRIRQIEQNPPVEQQGNTIRIGRFADDDLARNISITYEVTVPPDTKLAAHTGSGSIAVGAIKGPADVKSGSGSVTVGRVGGSVSASTGSGSIKVEGAASLEASTGSGAITAMAVAGPTKASSGSGSIVVTQAGKGDVNVSASSGGITLKGVDGTARVNSSSGSISIEGRPAGPWSLNASSGGITITVPADAAFDLDARSNSGNIDSVHPVTMEVTGKIDRRHVVGKVRGGGPLVQVHCSSGNIRIR